MGLPDGPGPAHGRGLWRRSDTYTKAYSYTSTYCHVGPDTDGDPVGAYMAPAWVDTGKYGGVIDLMLANGPGRWDVHISGSLTTTQKPSGRRFNQIVEFNPVKPTEVIGDLQRAGS